MALRSQIPAYYWYFGTVVDPLISLSAIYMAYFSSQTLLDPGFAASSPFGIITPSHEFLMHQLAGHFMAWVFLYLTLLRETNDIKVWTRFQQGMSFADVAIMYSQWKALESQGRLSLAGLRWEESSNAAIMVVILATRLSFIAGIGFGKSQGLKKTT